jgi:hypothetical protein
MSDADKNLALPKPRQQQPHCPQMEELLLKLRWQRRDPQQTRHWRRKLQTRKRPLLDCPAHRAS